MNRSLHYKALLLIAALCIATRLPQLLGSRLMLDGDECVVAIMAKHMMNHTAFYSFFYGQTYGFSLIECLFIMPFYLLCGINTIAVKTGMLLLWTVGVCLLYKSYTLANKTANNWLPLILTLVLICAPAWAIWSMKARGGYLTSFALTSLVLCILFGEKRSASITVLLGVLLFVIFHCQPLWIPGLAPFLALYTFREQRVANTLLFFTPIVVLSVALHYYNIGALQFGGIPIYAKREELWLRIADMPLYLYHSLHGNYYFDQLQKPNLFCAIWAVFFDLLIWLLISTAAWFAVKRRQGSLLFCLSGLSLLLTLSYTTFSYTFHGRYLLPVLGYALLSLLLLFNIIGIPRIFRMASVISIVVGTVAVITFYNFSFIPTTAAKFTNALDTIASRGAHYAYCSDNLVTWQIIFYSNENIIAREPQLPGRFPVYRIQVDSAYDAGGKTVLILPPGGSAPANYPRLEIVSDIIFLIDPPKDIILLNYPRGNKNEKRYYLW